jgi:hypothetical protein
VENDAALENERLASGNHNAENIDQLIQRAVPKKTESRQNIYAHDLVAANSDVATPTIVVRSCVTKDRVEHAEMLSLKKSAVIADAQYSNPLYHAARNLHLVDMNANDQRHVVTRRYPTAATEMTKLVPSVHFLRLSPVCVERTH